MYISFYIDHAMKFDNENKKELASIITSLLDIRANKESLFVGLDRPQIQDSWPLISQGQMLLNMLFSSFRILKLSRMDDTWNNHKHKN